MHSGQQACMRHQSPGCILQQGGKLFRSKAARHTATLDKDTRLVQHQVGVIHGHSHMEHPMGIEHILPCLCHEEQQKE
eukprot:53307-Eustigmatos_ZCMA.PRE.1